MLKKTEGKDDGDLFGNEDGSHIEGDDMLETMQEDRRKKVER